MNTCSIFNKSVKKISLAGMLVLSMLFTGTVASYLNAAEYEVGALKRHDQPFCFFKTTGKDPYLMKFYPASAQMMYITCGTITAKGMPAHISNTNDLASLTPLRLVSLSMDTSAKVDEKYPGYRETIVGKLLETVLKKIRILEDDRYKGTLLLDEYLAGMPLKMVFNTVEEFKAVRAYLEPLLVNAHALAPVQTKPLLYVTFEKPAQSLDAADQAFIDTYFTACNPADDHVSTFFKQAHDAIADALGALKDAKFVKESLAKTLFRHAESATKEFKGKDLVIVTTLFIASMLTYDLLKEIAKETIYKPVAEKVKNIVKKSSAAPAAA